MVPEFTARNVLLLAVSVAIAAMRVSGHKSEAFQAVAHLFVGGLLGAWLVGRLCRNVVTHSDRLLWAGLALALSVVEVVCFVAFQSR